MSGFSRNATVDCSTKRAVMTVGIQAEPTTHLTGLKCYPLLPLDPELQSMLQIDTMYTLLQTFIEGDYDIKEGDYLVISSKEYPIQSCARWPWRGSYRFRLVVEDLKR